MVGEGWLTQACRGLDIEASSWANQGLSGKTLSLWKDLRAFRPQILHTFGLRAEIVGRMLARATRVPVILSALHSPDPWRRWPHVWLDRLTAPWVDQFLAVSQTVARSRIERERFPKEKIVVIPNGIQAPSEADLARARKARQDRAASSGNVGPSIVMVGNLRPMKGHREALRSIAMLRRSFPQLRLTLVGKDVSEGFYPRMARDLGCAEHVEWAGYQENVAPYYANADLFLMPSYWEGCPTALLEAMSWGLPIVASDIPGIAEVARPNQEALLTPPRDPALLTAALRRLLRNPQMAENLGKSARQRILESYTLDRMVYNHERLYTRLIQAPEY